MEFTQKNIIKLLDIFNFQFFINSHQKKKKKKKTLYIAFPFYFIIIFIHPFHLYKQNPKNGLILFITKQMQSPFIKGSA